MKARVFKFCIHLQRVEIYCVKEKQDTVINFAFFFHLSFSPSVIQMFDIRKFVSNISQKL